MDRGLSGNFPGSAEGRQTGKYERRERSLQAVGLTEISRSVILAPSETCREASPSKVAPQKKGKKKKPIAK